MSASIKLTGTVARPAYTSVDTDGSIWLHVEIAGHAGSIAAAARQNYGRGNGSHYLAGTIARQLRTGAPVTVHAASYSVCLRPSPHLVLQAVSMIEQLARAADHTQPQEKAEHP